MKPKSFISLAVLTVVFVIAAIWSFGSQRGLTSIAVDRERAFPQLIENVNDVATVTIVSNKAKFTIARIGDGWGLAEKGGYKVSFEKVKSAIVGLGELKLLESKTADAARYERLQVENPGSLEAKSLGVELKDEDGKTMASGVIGKRHVGLFGQGGGGTYLRRGEDALSWLAEGIVDLGPEPNDWMVRDIVNLEAEDIARGAARPFQGHIPDGAGKGNGIIQRLDQADIRQARFAFHIDDIGRLHIAMRQTARMQMGQCTGKMCPLLQALGNGQVLAGS